MSSFEDDGTCVRDLPVVSVSSSLDTFNQSSSFTCCSELIKTKIFIQSSVL